MDWIEKLQVPGLILAAGVIVIQAKIIVMLIKDGRDRDERVTAELAENTKITARIAGILDLMCKRIPK